MPRIEVVCTLDTVGGKYPESDPKNPKIYIRSHIFFGGRVRLKVGSEEHTVIAKDLIDAVRRASD